MLGTEGAKGGLTVLGCCCLHLLHCHTHLRSLQRTHTYTHTHTLLTLEQWQGRELYGFALRAELGRTL